ncbi:MAG: IS21-like element helper ATPase IstB [Clostridiaceae bacterium]|nr:IS21-like element helper ATPase IstB [Clostridiaceae bacterium]
MNNITAERLKSMHLSGIAKSLDMRVEQAIREKLSYQEFVEILLADEASNRTSNGNTRRMQRAHFPCQKSIEEFDFNAQPSINRQHIYQLGTCEFIRKKENITFIGKPGTGKTHLSIAIGVKAVLQGYSVLFTTLNDMLDDLFMSRADNSFHRHWQNFVQPDLLIIDELGLRKLNQTSVDDFYEVIAKRYEKKATIITSNKEFNEWGRVLYDPVLATAILDRLVHHCNFVNIKGPSFRMREREGLEIIPPKKRGRPAKTVARPDEFGDDDTAEEEFDDEET